MIEIAVINKLAQANASFTIKQARVTALIEQLRIDISQVAHGKLEEVPALLTKHEQEYTAAHVSFEERNKVMLDMAHADGREHPHLDGRLWRMRRRSA